VLYTGSVPDRRRHRGAHPEDARLFGPDAVPALRSATSELSWLYERGYKQVSSLKLVGDRHALTERQRAAVARAACAESTAAVRRARRITDQALRGAVLCIDGFNVLTTLEVALSGGVVVVGRDGVLRDIAGVHGSYRRVAETQPALERLASYLTECGVVACEWLLDQPVSNSGRLDALMRELTRERGLGWQVHVVPDPDPLLAQSQSVVASADGAVLDAAARSFNLARSVVERCIPGAWLVDLSCDV
jgi:hypothetical protein